ncbi:MAG TPA: hypothetical protein VFU47_09715, partial [Armatimonadota bacterium]|nr:hypothetical protein [Armatimonadota bacterium]
AASGLQANVANGVYRLKLANTNEAETFGFTFRGQLIIPANVQWYFETRLKIPTAITTNQVAVFVLCSTVTDVLDDITRNAWFRLQASMDLLAELDDATTDTDDQDTGKDLTADTYYVFSIQKMPGGKVQFRVRDASGQKETLLKEISGASFGANNLQPVILVQKSTGTSQPAIDVDYVLAIWERI